MEATSSVLPTSFTTKCSHLIPYIRQLRIEQQPKIERSDGVAKKRDQKKVKISGEFIPVIDDSDTMTVVDILENDQLAESVGT